MQLWGCSRARDIFMTLGPSSEMATCSFSYRFRESRNLVIVPGNQDRNAIPHVVRYLLRKVGTPQKWCDTPTWYLVVSRRHICATPHVATYRAVIVRYCNKTSMKDFAITSIARYEKYRCWGSKGETGKTKGKSPNQRKQNKPIRKG